MFRKFTRNKFRINNILINDSNSDLNAEKEETLERIINEWLSGDEEEQSKETSRGGGWGQSSTKTEKASDDSPVAISSKYSSLDDAFADLESI